MSATHAGPPKFACSFWRDETSIYMQLPNDSQVLRFPLTEGGLGKALKLIPTIIGRPGYLSGGHNIADKILVKAAKTIIRRRVLGRVTPEMKASALDIVRRRFK